MTPSPLPVIQMAMGSCLCLGPIFVKPTSEAGEYEYNKILVELISVKGHRLLRAVKGESRQLRPVLFPLSVSWATP